jgi:hypothetical protein
VTVEPTSAATGCVRGWVRQALEAEDGARRTPSADLGSPLGSALGSPESGAADLLAALVRQRVIELVHAQSATVGLPAPLATAIADLRAADRQLVPLQLLELARVRDVLDRAGARYLVVKGPALAVQTTGDVGARGYGDVDILVDPGSVADLVGLLDENGWRSTVPLPDPSTWAWRRLLYTGNELAFYGASSSVDLHWRLDPTLDSLPPFDVLWERRTSVEVGGLVVPTLAPRDTLAHLCFNVTRDNWRWLRSLVDIHRAARLDGAWERWDPPPLVVDALAVTDAHVGLPAATPGWVRDRVAGLPERRRARLARAAVSGQEGRERLSDGPGSRFWSDLRYELAASSTARDLRRTLGTVVLPGWAVRDVRAASAWRGVPAGVGRRTSDLTRRSLQHLATRREQ